VFKPMEGVRVLEVAQFTFVPSAGAVLADWGADVIKVEHATRGDAQRALAAMLPQVSAGGSGDSGVKPSFAPVMDGPNRGKRSVGLSLGHPDAAEVLSALIRGSDVFLTNFLPGTRARLGIDVDAVRAVNPDIIYAAGSSYARRGPEAVRGGYDGTAFWARGGSAYMTTQPGAPYPAQQPGGAYGDNLGGLAIAGGISAALFARSRGRGAATVDLSLLGLGAWATQLSVTLSLMGGGPVPPLDPRSGGLPLTCMYRTADDRWLALVMLQHERYWPEFCTRAGRPELAADERFASAERLREDNGRAAIALVAEIIASRTRDEWAAAFDGMAGQWAVVANPYEVGRDPALVADGMIADVTDAEGGTRQLVASPVHFNAEAPLLTRGPLLGEHTDEVLGQLGFSDARLTALKQSGAIR
jgi:crotonobetainyl-CoA:carnitine CoA-transferase CaiB-like acyl-CoA transferase